MAARIAGYAPRQVQSSADEIPSSTYAGASVEPGSGPDEIAAALRRANPRASIGELSRITPTSSETIDGVTVDRVETQEMMLIPTIGWVTDGTRATETQIITSTRSHEIFAGVFDDGPQWVVTNDAGEVVIIPSRQPGATVAVGTIGGGITWADEGRNDWVDRGVRSWITTSATMGGAMMHPWETAQAVGRAAAAGTRAVWNGVTTQSGRDAIWNGTVPWAVGTADYAWNHIPEIVGGNAGPGVLAGGVMRSTVTSSAVRSGLSVAESAAPIIVYRGITEADAIALRSGQGLAAKAPNGTWNAAEHVANSVPGARGAGGAAASRTSSPGALPATVSRRSKAGALPLRSHRQTGSLCAWRERRVRRSG